MLRKLKSKSFFNVDILERQILCQFYKGLKLWEKASKMWPEKYYVTQVFVDVSANKLFKRMFKSHFLIEVFGLSFMLQYKKQQKLDSG